MGISKCSFAYWAPTMFSKLGSILMNATIDKDFLSSLGMHTKVHRGVA